MNKVSWLLSISHHGVGLIVEFLCQKDTEYGPINTCCSRSGAKYIEEAKQWHVIMGFDREERFSLISGEELKRVYKLIIIDSEKATPISMTIYKPWISLQIT